MTDTDRKKIKDQQKGEFVTTAGIADADAAVVAMHSRYLSYARTGSENAATNVAEVPMGINHRLSRLRGAYLTADAAVANDGTDYNKVYVFAFPAAGGALGAGTLVASWNTHTSAQSAITANAKHSMSLVTAAAASIAADSVFTMKIGKTGAGKAMTNIAITLDLEEI